MKKLYINVGTGIVMLHAPEVLVASIESIFPASAEYEPKVKYRGEILVTEINEASWQIAINNQPARGPFEPIEILRQIPELLEQFSAPTSSDEGTALKGSVLGWGDTSTLILGANSSGKSFLTAWMIDNGFSILSDGQFVLSPSGDRVSGFPGLLQVKDESASKLARLNAFSEILAYDHNGIKNFILDDAWYSKELQLEPSLAIIVSYEHRKEFGLQPLTSDQAYQDLLKLYSDLDDIDRLAVKALVETTPMVKVNYGFTSQLDGIVDQLAQYAAQCRPDNNKFYKFTKSIGSSGIDEKNSNNPIPEATKRKKPVKLTIGMATYDDYDGVYFSLQAIRIYHPEILDQVEFLVIDNHPDGLCAEHLKNLEEQIPNYRYVPENKIVGTAIRDRIFEEASGDFVLCMDSHVFFEPAALTRLLDYFDKNPDSIDLIQGPLVFDDLDNIATHFVPGWRAGMYGYWGTDDAGIDPDAPPFDIPMQGLGIFACRKDAWLGFNPMFNGFGGEEGYIHQKFRNAGARTLCLPFLRWVHRFNRPFGTRYPNIWEQRLKNYLIGWNEVGMPIEPLVEHFKELISEKKIKRVMSEVEGKLSKPLIAETTRQAKNKPKICFLHIGKTGGTFIRSTITHSFDHPSYVTSQKGDVLFADHTLTLQNSIEKHGSDRLLGFMFRDPTARFCSAFNDRIRRGGPIYYGEWSPEEAISFSYFQTPNDMAEALDGTEHEKSAANFAFKNISHVQAGLQHYLGSADAIRTEYENNRILVCCETTEINANLPKILSDLGLDSQQINQDAKENNAPDRSPVYLSERAIKNLKHHLVAEYEIYHLLTKIADAKGY